MGMGMARSMDLRQRVGASAEGQPMALICERHNRVAERTGAGGERAEPRRVPRRGAGAHAAGRPLTKRAKRRLLALELYLRMQARVRAKCVCVRVCV